MFVDLDGVLDQAGELRSYSWARLFVDGLSGRGYMARSVSGLGIHVVVRGQVPPGKREMVWALHAMVRWLDEHQMKERVSYFFEAGHQLNKTANVALGKLAMSPVLREEAHYHSHAFIAKRDARALQAADLLAWLWQKEWRDSLEVPRLRPRRRDLDSLLGLRHLSCHLSLEQLQRTLASVGQDIPGKFRRFNFRNYAR